MNAYEVEQLPRPRNEAVTQRVETTARKAGNASD
jgi:hypothetical protein